MLGGEDEVFKPVFLCELGPLVGADAYGIEAFVHADILIAEGFFV